ncbi:DUF1275 domain-containing protein [Bradyrhizobium viridifuturi]|jgi:uncharacterized membrane protein YoaK (UPF0700 family)|nr:YoaK family protein [Bradyrhizobium viridifuturi]ERF81869.1 MAG: NADH-quinone oxidoreductase subunit K [Bradyrhizobium sp. DFCI-1]MCA3794923.1 DUF1275 domain-containing protein [Burkholderia sp.]OYU61789.1 MAG: DUF1275 domain-containing protein [Bradyrhizobium sp. PARBB1]PSO17674.1 DUF1275 domain-containing protein [Bradyrhizobium sp. MOS004]QRI68318.1 DUF1275 domain-containing protein [Bradyrhizobium sp. PSBB068]HAQ81247.1 DUF1275 domain-containing protein [Bradyrhizobium sp.]
MEALSPHSAARKQVAACVPEQSLLVACLLSMSGGFIDAFTWLSLGGVFANSQTGNVVFLGVYAASGQWFQALHHVPPILAFVAGAWVATTVRAPLLCLAGEIVSLTVVMLLLHRLAEPVAVIGVAFGVALQTASFRLVERWKYLSVTVTGNTLRAIDLLVTDPRREAVRGAKVILTICLMFLLGAAAGALATKRLGAGGLIVPIALLTFALALCGRRHRWQA